MAKKFKSSDRFLKPDYKFNNKVVSKFINCLMWGGKKSLAERIFYQALDEIAKKVNDKPPVEVFNKAINNVKPLMEVRSRRIGGATYQVPVTVSAKRQASLAVRWILQAVRKKSGKPIFLKLSDELVAAYKGEGDAMTIRENVHRMAEANKAFAHFAW